MFLKEVSYAHQDQ